VSEVFNSISVDLKMHISEINRQANFVVFLEDSSAHRINMRYINFIRNPF
jgi:hypothetical protein